MRKILITLAVLILVVLVFPVTWIFYGRRMPLLLDRFGTIEMTSARINSIAYQGNGTMCAYAVAWFHRLESGTVRTGLFKRTA